MMLHLGDCRTVMATMPEASFDSIVTDPPYGLSFMGRSWDYAVPGPDFWTAALRVAKPGAHLVAFGGTRTWHRLTCAIEDAGWEIRDCLSWMYGTGFPKSHNGEWGGTALKPAWEPIVLARKPLVGTVAATHEAHGTGGLNIDGCRIGDEVRVNPPAGNKSGGASLNMSRVGMPSDASGRIATGRWPANVLLDEEAAAALDEQAPLCGSWKSKPARRPGGWFTHCPETTDPPSVVREQGRVAASRFFYCAKASKRERGEGNDWPTVKPLALMRWLCRLVTPPGGRILDPFHGSGSTLLAARDEGFGAVGIDMDEHAREIAKRRLGMQEAA